MKQRVIDLEFTLAAIRPYLPQFLQEHGIDTSKNFKCINPKHDDTNASMTCKAFPESAHCFGCLEENEEVWTPNGLIAIKDLQINDEIFTASGKIETVTNIINKTGSLNKLHLRMMRNDPLKLTPDHTCLVVRGEDAYKYLPYLVTNKATYCGYAFDKRHYRENKKRISRNNHKIKIIELEASEVKENDYILFPVISKEISKLQTLSLSPPLNKTLGPKVSYYNTLDLTEDFAYVLGLYIAEGSCAGRTVRWTFNIKEANTLAKKVIDTISKIFNYTASIYLYPERHTAEVYVSSLAIAAVFSELGGSLANGKHLPNNILLWPTKMQKAVLSGWLDGDSGATISKKLAHQVFGVMIQTELLPSVTYREADIDKTGQKHSQNWIYNKRIRPGTECFYEYVDGIKYLFLHVKKNEETTEIANVVDISVSTEETFLTRIGGVHNCHGTVDIFTAAHYLDNKPIRGPEFIEENIKYLANKYDVSIRFEDLTQEEIYEFRTYSAYKLAAQLISDCNFGDYSVVDKEIERRGWDKQKIASWGIGTVNYEEFKERMKAAGFEPKFLAGIDLDRSNLFNNNNLLFTVTDEFGRPVGFSAKNLKHNSSDETTGPKYLNTKGTGLECAIFKKGERLYGFDIAKDAASPLYIFEGQADVITARHFGVLNCCCTLGTAFTDHHINLLKRYGNFNIVIVFDGDKAGEDATQKVIDEKFSKEKDFRVKLCQLPVGLDPDELLRTKGIDEFVRLKKWTAFEWRLSKFLLDPKEEIDDDRKREIAEKMTPIIVSEKSYIRQEEMAKQVARMTGYDLSTIISEVKRLRNEKEAEIGAKKKAVVEALLWEAQKNPDSAELALSQAQTALEEINKASNIEDLSSETLGLILSQKEKDEQRTKDFAGFFMKPEGLGSLAARLDDDWKSDTLFFIGGSEQSGKCEHFSSLIPLPSGEYKTIQEVCEKRIDTILTKDNNNKIIPANVSRWINSGKLPCYELKTHHGLNKKSSHVHPYLTLDGWKKMEDLAVGDSIAIVRNYDCFNNLHSPISEDEAIILAGLLSEGSLTSAFGFCNTDNEVIEVFKNAVENKWGTNLGYRTEAYTLYISDQTQNGSRLLDWLRFYNLFGTNAHTKYIPDVIFQCSLKRISKFLGMFWAGDGWVHFNSDNKKCEVGLALANHFMIKQIRSLLLRFGINAKITYSPKKSQSGKTFSAWTLSIKDIENIKKFYNNIKIPLKYKQDNLKKILDSGKNSFGAYNDNFPSSLWNLIESLVKEKGWSFNYLMTLIGEDKNRFYYDKSKDRYKEIAAWYPIANCREEKGTEYLQITPRKLRLIGHLLQNDFLVSLADGDIYFDQIISINSIGEQQCYDLEVPDSHNFIADDVVVHNSTLCSQMAYEIADDKRNNAICIYHSIDDAARMILYKWICQASQNLDLKLNYISNPNYWLTQPGMDFITKVRERAYKKIIELVKEERLVLKDSSNGQSIKYMEQVSKFYRDKYPDKNIVIFIDNFHKLPDLGEIQGHERTKRLSNIVKNMTVEQHVTIVATAEYKKLPPREKPTNESMAESRALSYDASILLHLYNDLHQSSSEDALYVHQDKQGNVLPRIWCKFGKNKISGYEGLEYLDLFGYAGQYRSVDLKTAEEENAARKFLVYGGVK